MTEDFLLARDTVITICTITDHARVRIHIACLETFLHDHWVYMCHSNVNNIHCIISISNQKALHLDYLKTISSSTVLHRPSLKVNAVVNIFWENIPSLLVFTVTTIVFLSLLVLIPGVVMEDPYWQSFMEQAVRLIYFLAESPEQLCSRLLQRSARLLLDQIAEGHEINKDSGQMEDGSQESNEQSEQGESYYGSVLRA